MIKTLKKKESCACNGDGSVATVTQWRSVQARNDVHSAGLAQKWYLNGTPFSGDTEMNDVQTYEM